MMDHLYGDYDLQYNSTSTFQKIRNKIVEKEKYRDEYKKFYDLYTNK
jgi:hypothetical protein